VDLAIDIARWDVRFDNVPEEGSSRRTPTSGAA
jgi:hypothetical protein